MKGAPELEDAVAKTRLYHASVDEVAAAAMHAGGQPAAVRAFHRGGNIFVPPGKGVGLGTLAHEVKHVEQFFSVKNFGQAYEAAKQRGLKRGLSVRKAYEFNYFEREARAVQRAVIEAN